MGLLVLVLVDMQLYIIYVYLPVYVCVRVWRHICASFLCVFEYTSGDKMCTFISLCISKCSVCLYVCVWLSECVCVCVCVSENMCLHACVFVRMSACAIACMHVCVLQLRSRRTL